MMSVSVDTHSWTDWSTEKGRTYTYWVAARNSVGASPMSVEATITIPESPESQSAILVISTISVALASCGGVLLWYRRTKMKKAP
jgi:nitrate reductase gamma subunit